MSMRQSFTIHGIKKRHGQLVRAVSVFFLLFTAGDIALPQYFCGGEEIGGLPLNRVIASDEVGDSGIDRAAVPAPEAPLPGQDSKQVPHEEDCFCCCAHVLPGLAFTAATSGQLTSLQRPLEQESLPSPPLPLQYHPPRFA